MSTHPQLKDLLEQAAETVPPAEVPRDTWRRGRRRHHRSLALRAAAVVGVVALVAVTPGLVDRATDRSLPQPAGDGSSSLGLPDRLHEVPSYLGSGGERERWADDVVSDDLATGTVAAAWVTRAGLPVLVDATDGTYHLLDLPDFLLTSGLTISWFPGDAPPLALSPDGDHLAYAYAWPATDDGTAVPSGIRVVDLATGEVTRDLPLEGGAGVLVTQVSWSPAGSWLAWSGFETSYWTTSGLNGSKAVTETVAPDGTRRRLPAGGSTVVDDDGTTAVLTGGQVRVHRPDGARSARRPIDILEATEAASLAPDGSRLALGAQEGYDLVTVRLDRDEVSTRSGEGPGDGSWSVRPLGWVDDAVLVQRTPPASGDEGRLSLVPVDGDRPVRDVAALDGGVGPLSVATDLVTEQRPTVSRPAPDWPWSEERWVLTVGLGGLGLLVAGGLAWLVRRRAQRRPAR